MSKGAAMKCCEMCKWWKRFGKQPIGDCEFPMPAAVEETGMMYKFNGENCPTYEAKS